MNNIDLSQRMVQGKRYLYDAAMNKVNAAVVLGYGLEEAIEGAQQTHLEWLTAAAFMQQEMIEK